MNLRNAIEAYANAVSNYYRVVGYGKQEAESIARLAIYSRSLDAMLAVAEAAIAHAEFQVSVHSRNGDDAPMDGATYIRERGKLWDAFLEARARAKAANQS